jgi:hypothetical protein
MYDRTYQGDIVVAGVQLEPTPAGEVELIWEFGVR